jgi:hypothetical protein
MYELKVKAFKKKKKKTLDFYYFFSILYTRGYEYIKGFRLLIGCTI